MRQLDAQSREIFSSIPLQCGLDRERDSPAPHGRHQDQVSVRAERFARQTSRTTSRFLYESSDETMREVGLIVVILGPVFGFAGWIWERQYGAASLPAFAWAAGVCFSCGIIALLVQELAFRVGSPFTGTIGSIAARTLGPMAFAIAIPARQPELVSHGIFPAFVGCYLLTLTVETILSVCLIQRWETRSPSR